MKYNFSKIELYIFSFISLIFIANNSYARHTTFDKGDADRELWTAISIEKEFDDFSLIFKQDIRTQENFINHFNATNTYIGGEYKYNDYLKFSILYRYVYKEDNKSNDQLLLIYSPKHEIDNFEIKYRLRYQYVNKETPENVLRNRIGCGYKFDDLIDPYVNYELFYKFNEPGKHDEFYRQRFELGNSFEINNENSFSLSYRYEMELNKKEDIFDKADKSHIIKIEYEYSF